MTDNSKSSNHSNAAVHTIIAALRFWQESGMVNEGYRSEDLELLATNGGELETALNLEEIDDLVERLNTGELELVTTSSSV